MGSAMDPAERNDRVLVTAGTGTLWNVVVPRLRDAGCEVCVLSRRSREGGEGSEFVAGDPGHGRRDGSRGGGAEIIVHCAGSSKGDEDKAVNLIRAASRARRGTCCTSRPSARPDSSRQRLRRPCSATSRPTWPPSGWWPTPPGIGGLRAAQFHDLILMTARQMVRPPVIPVAAGFRFQPGRPRDVAARLTELALGTPRGLVPEMAGRRVYGRAELPRGYLQVRRKHRRLRESSCQERRPARSRPAQTWPPSELRAGGPGSSSSPTGRDWQATAALSVSPPYDNGNKSVGMASRGGKTRSRSNACSETARTRRDRASDAQA
jgi:uncharacterized protein YbjT (DUF2867 family)